MAEAICKRCIHHDICDAYTGEETVNFFPYNEDCKHFKSRNDYTEVKHGKWEFIGDKYANCTNCGTIFEALPTKYVFQRNNLYCRHCGTEMDGKDEQ